LKKEENNLTNKVLAETSVSMAKHMREEGFRPSEAMLLLLSAAFAVYQQSNLSLEVDGSAPDAVTFNDFITQAEAIYNTCVVMNMGGGH
jgi:hypothetical protein